MKYLYKARTWGDVIEVCKLKIHKETVRQFNAEDGRINKNQLNRPNCVGDVISETPEKAVESLYESINNDISKYKDIISHLESMLKCPIEYKF